MSIRQRAPTGHIFPSSTIKPATCNLSWYDSRYDTVHQLLALHYITVM